MKANLTLVTPERQAEIKEAWNLIAEKKPSLRKKEVFKVMRALGMAPTEHEWKEMWTKMEPVHGKVEFHGFSHARAPRPGIGAPAKIQEAFELFDSERKQYFDANDLDRVMRSLNEHLTMDQIKDMILEVDCQGDYRINRDEFLDMMAT
ncbi:hypothetical protein AURANDRAFT_22351 [Aureococcus anophagefferens]|uniref:Calmodulin n=1 Tax=Aureococcus anophagefferens TaxID=44056 RepID=F0Y1Z3_AURAN|nr:hypothetical protein AURANDRAFT_22351 [Aureococcus anophagefferens]EGB10608.1 hypothetical protein AURANDRAFT_22351 [Aureococcus anophagefferens]|eukprot:XP_009034213.1 hypothetical protein AURANDRAFT_22351 [Aureococcus anophagefferens]